MNNFQNLNYYQCLVGHFKIVICQALSSKKHKADLPDLALLYVHKNIIINPVVVIRYMNFLRNYVHSVNLISV